MWIFARHPSAVQAVRKAAIEAKIQLSTEPAAQFDIELPNGDRYQREIPRAVFEQLIEPVLARTAGPCKQALTDAGITPEQIDEVVHGWRLHKNSCRAPIG